ncbi:unnamed protein product [Sphagnum balticum]
MVNPDGSIFNISVYSGAERGMRARGKRQNTGASAPDHSRSRSAACISSQIPGNFAVASEQFAQALQMARQYSPRTADEASCLQGLAEAYFGQYKFGDSKATYQQLEQLLDSWGETNRDGAPGVKNRKSPTAVAAASEAGAGQNNFEALQEFAGAHPKIATVCVCALLFGLLQVLSLLSAINDIKGMMRCHHPVQQPLVESTIRLMERNPLLF